MEGLKPSYVIADEYATSKSIQKVRNNLARVIADRTVAIFVLMFCISFIFYAIYLAVMSLFK